jgi:hypothetical protein
MNGIDLTNTLKAVPKWKAREEELIKLLYKVKSNAGWLQWREKEQKNDDMLRAAFADDTRDRNNRSSVMQMNPRDIVRFAETGSWR